MIDMEAKILDTTSQELYSGFVIHDVASDTLYDTDVVKSEEPLGYEEGNTCTDDSIVCFEINEGQDKENPHVTIIISDTLASDGSGAPLTPADARPAVTPVDLSNLCHFGKSLEQCLKLASSQKTDVCCFLCPKTYTSFAAFRKHLQQIHDLSHNVTQPSSLPPECITEMAKEIKKLECRCAAFTCPTCDMTQPGLLPLVRHVLLDHPNHYEEFTFFVEQKQKEYPEICQRCTVLDKLCQVDYDLFVRVLIEVECSDEDCRALLLSWPLSHYAEPCQWCAEEGEEGQGQDHTGNTAGTHGAEREVVCYRIKLKPSKSSTKTKASKCICPLLRCPRCPKTVGNYAELRKHVRQTGHSSWRDLRLVWEKYKVIKENCPACPKHSYRTYIVCPHCPHLTFESEKQAQTHMDSQHDTCFNAVCTCPDYFTCLECGASCPTPQSLHQHLWQMQHETPENLAAIPAMIEGSIRGRKGCPRCSLQESCEASSPQEEEECSCRWVECSTCKTSFRRMRNLQEHMQRAKHPMNPKDMRRERERLASSVVTCRRCCVEANRYCVLCQRKENFVYTHLRSLHQDRQIMLLQDDCGNLLEEHEVGGEGCGRLARYECSVCHVCRPHLSELVSHVRRHHPHHHLTLWCLDLREDVRQVKDFVGGEEVMVLNVVDKKL